MILEKPVWLQPDFNADTFLYQYRAILVRWYDADTAWFLIDKGMGTWDTGGWDTKKNAFKGKPVRLARINAWELRNDGGKEALAFAESFIAPGDHVRLFTYKDKYGAYSRLIADIQFRHEGATQCINDLIVQAGHGKYQRY